MKSTNSILEVKVAKEEDIIYVHQMVRELSILAGLSLQSQTRFITAVCEIAKNALQYAGGGIVRFFLVSENGTDYKLQACVEDEGPGLDSAEQSLRENSGSSKGKGIPAAKDLVHYFQIESNDKGTKVILEKNLPPNIVVSPEDTLTVWTNRLHNLEVTSIIEELQKQNHQLVKALTEVEKSAQILSQQQTLLGQHTEQLETANRMKTNFVANMSHEMRTPLNAVIGISDILSKTTLNKHQQFLVNSLDAAGRSLLSLINDILDLSKLEVGKFEIEDVDFVLIETINEALSVVQPQALEKYVDLLFFYGPSLPLKVKGDPHRLQQVIINIAANAIKFSSQNSETDVLVFNNGHANSITDVRFIILDTGIGISQNDQDKLFEAFTQIDSSTNRKYGGTGLGLSICQHLVGLMNGEIGFISKKDVGTAFWFSIPFNSTTPLGTSFRETLDSFEVVFANESLLSFELLLQSMGIKYRRLGNDNAAEELKASGDAKFIFIDDLPTEFASLKPSRLFNHLMERVKLPYRMQNFRSGKEKFLLGRKPFSKTLSECGDALLVEDHSMNQLIGRLQLEELGFNVEVCSTGTEAIQSVIRKKYSIIFMDCQMPEMDGYEVTHQIRSVEKQTSNRTPIIALTASALEGEREKCLSAGMDDYLTKPVEPEALYKTCKKWLPEVELDDREERITLLEHETTNSSEIIDGRKLARFSKNQYTQLVQMFQSDTVRILAELDNYLETRNMQAAIDSAHTLQGASRMIYAKSLADNYRNMEAAVRAQRWDAAKEILSEVRHQFAQVKDEFAKLNVRA